MSIVGSAEVVIRANTAGFESELKASTNPALSNLTNDASLAGKEAGAGLAGGVTNETKKLEGTLAKDGTSAGGALSKGMGGGISSIKSALGGLGVPESLMNPEAFGAVAIAGAAAAAIDLGEKMQSADAAIATSAGITTKAATSIGDAFLGTAGKTEFSGQAMATSFAAVAGQLKSANGAALTTKQSLDFMNASSDLATAKGIDLSTATSTLATTMQAFQIPMKGAAAATNVLFNVSNATGQGVDAVGASLDKLRGRLGAASPPLGQLGALMVDLTNNGITGRASLTAVNGAMTALIGAATGTSKANQAADAALKSFGVSALDANGKLTPMSTIIDELAPKFAKMTQAQQLQAATTIFGASAAKAMTTAIDAGAASYTKATDAVNNNNNVQDAAATKSKTMAVQFDTIKASVMDMATQLGENLMPIIQQLMPVIGTLVTAVGTLLTGAFTILHPIIQAAIGIVKSLVAILTDLINFVVDVFTGKWSAAWKSIEKLFSDLVSLAKSAFGGLITYMTSIPGKILAALGDGAKVLLHWGEDLVKGIANGILGAADAIGRALSSAVRAGIADVKKAVNSIPVIGAALSAIGLATGGYVTSPTLALVGEAGPEFVIPESLLKSQFAGVKPLSIGPGPGGSIPTGTPSSGVTHMITISPGAVVINPAPGNDTASLNATKQLVNDALETAFDHLLGEYLAGSTPLTAAM